jgi:hypothetical protein
MFDMFQLARSREHSFVEALTLELQRLATTFSALRKRRKEQ